MSTEPPGGRGMARLVAVMDTLRSPGGCPWDALQTHETLVPFALEEAHELAEAIEAGDRAGMREELGDVLLQVVFHARLAQEHETDAFDLDDVADAITAKLVRRHPHVFARPADVPARDAATATAPAGGPIGGAGPSADAPTAPAAAPADGPADGPWGVPAAPTPDATPDATPAAGSADDVHVRWEQIKRAEKARTSVLDGIALGQGSLSRGETMLSRARRGGVSVDVAGVARAHRDLAPPERAASADMGARLLELLGEADASGVDAEAALRAALRALESAVRAAEAG